MMRKANAGKERKDWKPPAGYKSALGKARDEARTVDKRKKAAALESGDGTASDDDDCDFGSQHGIIIQGHRPHSSTSRSLSSRATEDLLSQQVRRP